jgi:hypothetical protein
MQAQAAMLQVMQCLLGLGHQHQGTAFRFPLLLHTGCKQFNSRVGVSKK